LTDVELLRETECME